jgi:molecular chaperone GrpE (heat shock protein)
LRGAFFVPRTGGEKRRVRKNAEGSAVSTETENGKVGLTEELESVKAELEAERRQVGLLRQQNALLTAALAECAPKLCRLVDEYEAALEHSRRADGE